ncbi:MAG: hypothetical protein HYZ25_03545 [Chloroflexi bacterium]|nr:hypothetical protein [Chloroflexota bacterium]
MVGVIVGGARVGSGVSVGKGVSLGNGVSGTTSLAGGCGVSVDGKRAVGALIDDTVMQALKKTKAAIENKTGFFIFLFLCMG